MNDSVGVHWVASTLSSSPLVLWPSPQHARRRRWSPVGQKLRPLAVWESIKTVGCSTERHLFLACRPQSGAHARRVFEQVVVI